MSALAITSVTVQELHALHEQMTQPDPKTGKRLDPGVAVFFAVALVLDQRLEEICRAIKNIQPVKVVPQPQLNIVANPPKDWTIPKAHHGPKAKRKR